jgi:hypothetical protein
VPDNEPYQNAPHLVPRMAVPAASHPPAIGQHEHSSAIQIEEHFRAGDLGAIRRHIVELEHGLGPWTANPWRLLEHLCARGIGRQQEAAPAASNPGT